MHHVRQLWGNLFSQSLCFIWYHVIRIPIGPPPPTPDDSPSNPGRERKSLLREHDSCYKGSAGPGMCSGSSFCPGQVLLGRTFHSRPGCRQKSLARTSGVGCGGELFYPHLKHSSESISWESCFSLLFALFLWKF